MWSPRPGCPWPARRSVLDDYDGPPLPGYNIEEEYQEITREYEETARRRRHPRSVRFNQDFGERVPLNFQGPQRHETYDGYLASIYKDPIFAGIERPTDMGKYGRLRAPVWDPPQPAPSPPPPPTYRPFCPSENPGMILRAPLRPSPSGPSYTSQTELRRRARIPTSVEREREPRPRRVFRGARWNLKSKDPYLQKKRFIRRKCNRPQNYRSGSPRLRRPRTIREEQYHEYIPPQLQQRIGSRRPPCQAALTTEINAVQSQLERIRAQQLEAQRRAEEAEQLRAYSRVGVLIPELASRCAEQYDPWQDAIDSRSTPYKSRPPATPTRPTILDASCAGDGLDSPLFQSPCIPPGPEGPPPIVGMGFVGQPTDLIALDEVQMTPGGPLAAPGRPSPVSPDLSRLISPLNLEDDPTWRSIVDAPPRRQTLTLLGQEVPYPSPRGPPPDFIGAEERESNNLLDVWSPGPCDPGFMKTDDMLCDEILDRVVEGFNRIRTNQPKHYNTPESPPPVTPPPRQPILPPRVAPGSSLMDLVKNVPSLANEFITPPPPRMPTPKRRRKAPQETPPFVNMVRVEQPWTPETPEEPSPKCPWPSPPPLRKPIPLPAPSRRAQYLQDPSRPLYQFTRPVARRRGSPAHRSCPTSPLGAWPAPVRAPPPAAAGGGIDPGLFGPEDMAEIMEAIHRIEEKDRACGGGTRGRGGGGGITIKTPTGSPVRTPESVKAPSPSDPIPLEFRHLGGKGPKGARFKKGQPGAYQRYIEDRRRVRPPLPRKLQEEMALQQRAAERKLQEDIAPDPRAAQPQLVPFDAETLLQYDQKCFFKMRMAQVAADLVGYRETLPAQAKRFYAQGLGDIGQKMMGPTYSGYCEPPPNLRLPSQRMDFAVDLATRGIEWATAHPDDARNALSYAQGMVPGMVASALEFEPEPVEVPCQPVKRPAGKPAPRTARPPPAARAAPTGPRPRQNIDRLPAGQRGRAPKDMAGSSAGPSRRMSEYDLKKLEAAERRKKMMSYGRKPQGGRGNC